MTLLLCWINELTAKYLTNHDISQSPGVFSTFLFFTKLFFSCFVKHWLLEYLVLWYFFFLDNIWKFTHPSVHFIHSKWMSLFFFYSTFHYLLIYFISLKFLREIFVVHSDSIRLGGLVFDVVRREYSGYTHKKLFRNSITLSISQSAKKKRLQMNVTYNIQCKFSYFFWLYPLIKLLFITFKSLYIQLYIYDPSKKKLYLYVDSEQTNI